MECGVYRVDATAQTIQVSESWLAGNYGLSGGGFAYLIGSLVGGLIGGNLALSSMPFLARIAATVKLPGKGRSFIRPDEYVRAWQEWREARWPEYFFLGRVA